MDAELLDLLSAYLADRATVADVAEWVTGVDWADPTIDDSTREAVGMLELLATEVVERMRPEVEIRDYARGLLNAATHTVITLGVPSMAVQSGSSNEEADERFVVTFADATQTHAELVLIR